MRAPRDKGRVERAVRYLRDRFLAGREIRDVTHGNRELEGFLRDIAPARPHVRHGERTVGAMFEEERAHLLPLPEAMPVAAQTLPVAIDATAFAHFDTNLYSVPSSLAHKGLTLVADDRDLLTRLRTIGLRLSTEALRTLVRNLHGDRATPTQTLERLAEAERLRRDASNLARRTHVAMVGTPKSLDQYDWSFPRAMDRGLYESLATIDFTAKGDTVFLRGGAETGKTTLAQHLVLTALAKGLTVRFATLSTLLADLLRQESTPALERRLKRYTGPSLLCVEEVGIGGGPSVTLSRRAA